MSETWRDADQARTCTAHRENSCSLDGKVYGAEGEAYFKSGEIGGDCGGLRAPKMNRRKRDVVVDGVRNGVQCQIL